MPGAAIAALRGAYGIPPIDNTCAMTSTSRFMISFVVGAAFPRTGTTSLKMALERLGFGRTYHIDEMLHRKHLRLWDVPDADYEKYLFKNKPNFTQIFESGQFRSGVDVPFCLFWQDIFEHFGPSAKVILTIRDPEEWYESVRTTIYKNNDMPDSMYKLAYQVIPELKHLWDWQIKSHWGPWQFENKTHAIGVYQKYQEHVRATVPPHQLLEYSVQDGWQPLCEFLGVPVPSEPFPRTNSRAAQKENIKKLEAIGAALYNAAHSSYLPELS